MAFSEFWLTLALSIPTTNRHAGTDDRYCGRPSARLPLSFTDAQECGPIRFHCLTPLSQPLPAGFQRLLVHEGIWGKI